MADFREVPISRIKVLSGIHYYMSDNEEYTKEVLITQIGREIALKLMEHEKVLIIRDKEGLKYSYSIEVIIPEPTYK